jgi:predicted O-methyltransferase YrrM
MAGLEYGQVQEYLTGLVPERHEEFYKMEEIAREERFPIIGPAAGYFCYQIARLLKAKNIFELGSGFGYSTAWFAKALEENGGGKVWHTVWDEDLSNRAREHLEALGYTGLVEFRISESVEALQNTPGPFDLIFNDIDKHGYPGAMPAIKEKLRPGGALIIDNTLLGGRIFDPKNTKPNAEGVREVTRIIKEDPDWDGMIVPIRDGLMMAYRR